MSGGSGAQDVSGVERWAGGRNPAALLPKLYERQFRVLQRVGRVCGDPEVWLRALPVDCELSSYPAEIHPTRFGQFRIGFSTETGIGRLGCIVGGGSLPPSAGTVLRLQASAAVMRVDLIGPRSEGLGAEPCEAIREVPRSNR